MKRTTECACHPTLIATSKERTQCHEEQTDDQRYQCRTPIRPAIKQANQDDSGQRYEIDTIQTLEETEYSIATVEGEWCSDHSQHGNDEATNLPRPPNLATRR